MALTSTIYNAAVELNDVDRGVYESSRGATVASDARLLFAVQACKRA
jgi:uncharacterized protein YaeQ